MMSVWAGLCCIAGTWVIAAALVPTASKWGNVYSTWPTLVINSVGCSGSIVAVCLVR